MFPEVKIMEKKFQQYTFKLLRSNGVSTAFLLRDLDLHFGFKKFNCYISETVRAGAKMCVRYCKV